LTEDRLYHEQLLMLARQVREQPLLENPTHTAEMTNPTCGDKVTVMLALVDDHVKEISVHVRGCAICEASAGILLNMVKHQPEPALPVAMLDHMSDDIKQWFISPSDAAAPFSSLSAMTPIKTSYRNRQRCATLAFEAASLAAKTPNVLFKGN
jgi:nitrogen fixation NifU-like protein